MELKNTSQIQNTTRPGRPEMLRSGVAMTFVVGFVREYIKASHSKMIEAIKNHHHDRNGAEAENFLNEFRRASVSGMLAAMPFFTLRSMMLP